MSENIFDGGTFGTGLLCDVSEGMATDVHGEIGGNLCLFCNLLQIFIDEGIFCRDLLIELMTQLRLHPIFVSLRYKFRKCFIVVKQREYLIFWLDIIVVVVLENI